MLNKLTHYGIITLFNALLEFFNICLTKFYTFEDNVKITFIVDVAGSILTLV